MTRLAVLDLGGTRLKAGLLEDGAAEPTRIVAVPHDGTMRGALDLVELVLDQLTPDGCDAVGMGVPGLVDDDGQVLSLPGKLAGATTTDLRARLQQRTRGPVRIVNDAVAAALGEAEHGAGRGYRRVMVVTLGTGVGTAVVEGGRPLGAGALGGGLCGGGVPIPGSGGGVDSAGRRGTFEARCSAAALLAAVVDAGCPADDVAAAWMLFVAGDPAAVRGVSTYREDLIAGLVALACAHAPDVLVVGGGAARPALLDGAESAVRARLFPGQSLDVRLTELGDAAALVGLGSLLREVA